MSPSPSNRRRPVVYGVHGVVKTYASNAAPVNDGVDLTVMQGEILGLVGPNGAGKTTLVRQLMGLLLPDAGTVTLHGTDLATDPRAPSLVVGYLAQQETAIADLPLRVAVTSTGRLRGLTRRVAAEQADDLLAELGIEQLRSRPLVRLSGGERRLGAIACALVADRPVLVLDEPTAGLDPAARRQLWAALTRRQRERAVTVLVVSHDMVELDAVADRVAVLSAGRVVACETPGVLKASMGDHVTLRVVWREPATDLQQLAESMAVGVAKDGQRWQLRLPLDDAQTLLRRLTDPEVVHCLDDFALATSSLDDVWLAFANRSAAAA